MNSSWLPNNLLFYQQFLYQLYQHCTGRYGIDCQSQDSAFQAVCESPQSLWDACQSPLYASDHANLTDILDQLARPAAPDQSCERIRCLRGSLLSLVQYLNLRFFYVYAPIAALMCVIALVANALGLYGLRQIPSKYPRHYLLISMSISDTLLSFLTLMKKTGDVIAESAIKYFFIRYLNVFWQATFLASASMLLALALEVSVALTATFFYEKSAHRKGAVISFILTVWFISFLIPVVLLLTKNAYTIAFQYAVSALLLLIIVATISCYIYAFLLAERARRQIRHQQISGFVSEPIGDTQQLGRRRSLITVSFLMTSSIVSWLPLNIYWLLGRQVESDFPFYTRLIHCFLLMFHLNAIINPLTYVLRMNAVRQRLSRAFKSNQTPSPYQTPKKGSHPRGSCHFRSLTDEKRLSEPEQPKSSEESPKSDSVDCQTKTALLETEEQERS